MSFQRGPKPTVLSSTDHSRLKKLKPHGTIVLEHSGEVDFNRWKNAISNFASYHYRPGNYVIRSYERKTVTVHRHYYEVKT